MPTYICECDFSNCRSCLPSTVTTEVMDAARIIGAYIILPAHQDQCDVLIADHGNYMIVKHVNVKAKANDE